MKLHYKMDSGFWDADTDKKVMLGDVFIYIAALDEQLKDARAMIEKMRCCENCKNLVNNRLCFVKVCDDRENWQPKEK